MDIGDKTRWYGKYRVDYRTSTSQGWSERTLLYILFHADSWAIPCRDQDQCIVEWFSKRGEIWD